MSPTRLSFLSVEVVVMWHGAPGGSDDDDFDFDDDWRRSGQVLSVVSCRVVALVAGVKKLMCLWICCGSTGSYIHRSVLVCIIYIQPSESHWPLSLVPTSLEDVAHQPPVALHLNQHAFRNCSLASLSLSVHSFHVVWESALGWCVFDTGESFDVLATS